MEGRQLSRHITSKNSSTDELDPHPTLLNGERAGLSDHSYVDNDFAKLEEIRERRRARHNAQEVQNNRKVAKTDDCKESGATRRPRHATAAESTRERRKTTDRSRGRKRLESGPIPDRRRAGEEIRQQRESREFVPGRDSSLDALRSASSKNSSTTTRKNSSVSDASRLRHAQSQEMACREITTMKCTKKWTNFNILEMIGKQNATKAIEPKIERSHASLVEEKEQAMSSVGMEIVPFCTSLSADEDCNIYDYLRGAMTVVEVSYDEDEEEEEFRRREWVQNALAQSMGSKETTSVSAEEAIWLEFELAARQWIERGSRAVVEQQMKIKEERKAACLKAKQQFILQESVFGQTTVMKDKAARLKSEENLSIRSNKVARSCVLADDGEETKVRASILVKSQTDERALRTGEVKKSKIRADKKFNTRAVLGARLDADEGKKQTADESARVVAEAESRHVVEECPRRKKKSVLARSMPEEKERSKINKVVRGREENKGRLLSETGALAVVKAEAKTRADEIAYIKVENDACLLSEDKNFSIVKSDSSRTGKEKAFLESKHEVLAEATAKEKCIMATEAVCMDAHVEANLRTRKEAILNAEAERNKHARQELRAAAYYMTGEVTGFVVKEESVVETKKETQMQAKHFALRNAKTERKSMNKENADSRTKNVDEGYLTVAMVEDCSTTIADFDARAKENPTKEFVTIAEADSLKLTACRKLETTVRSKAGEMDCEDATEETYEIRSHSDKDVCLESRDEACLVTSTDAQIQLITAFETAKDKDERCLIMVNKCEACLDTNMDAQAQLDSSFAATMANDERCLKVNKGEVLVFTKAEDAAQANDKKTACLKVKEVVLLSDNNAHLKEDAAIIAETDTAQMEAQLSVFKIEVQHDARCAAAEIANTMAEIECADSDRLASEKTCSTAAEVFNAEKKLKAANEAQVDKKVCSKFDKCSLSNAGVICSKLQADKLAQAITVDKSDTSDALANAKTEKRLMDKDNADSRTKNDAQVNMETHLRVDESFLTVATVDDCLTTIADFGAGAKESSTNADADSLKLTTETACSKLETIVRSEAAEKTCEGATGEINVRTEVENQAHSDKEACLESEHEACLETKTNTTVVILDEAVAQDETRLVSLDVAEAASTKRADTRAEVVCEVRMNTDSAETACSKIEIWEVAKKAACLVEVEISSKSLSRLQRGADEEVCIHEDDNFVISIEAVAKAEDECCFQSKTSRFHTFLMPDAASKIDQDQMWTKHEPYLTMNKEAVCVKKEKRGCLEKEEYTQFVAIDASDVALADEARKFLNHEKRASIIENKNDYHSTELKVTEIVVETGRIDACESKKSIDNEEVLLMAFGSAHATGTEIRRIQTEKESEVNEAEEMTKPATEDVALDKSETTNDECANKSSGLRVEKDDCVRQQSGLDPAAEFSLPVPHEADLFGKIPVQNRDPERIYGLSLFLAGFGFALFLQSAAYFMRV